MDPSALKDISYDKGNSERVSQFQVKDSPRVSQVLDTVL